MEYHSLEREPPSYKRQSQANKARKQSTIQVGDLVTLNACHLVLKAITRKLKPRFLEPFQVEEQMGANNLKLTLPATM